MTQVGATGKTHLSRAWAVPTSLPGSRMSLSQSLSSKNLPPPPALDTASGWVRRSQAGPAVMQTSPAQAGQGSKEEGCPRPRAHGGVGTHRVLSPSRPLNMPLRTDSS